MAVAKKQVSLRGCLAAVAGAWLVWLLIDLTRLGAFRGEQDVLGFVFSAPSVFVPLLILLVGSPGIVQHRLRERRKHEFPDEPWMWDRRWHRGGARPLRSGWETAREMTPALMATGFLALFLTFIFFVLSPDDRPPAFISIPVVVFALGAWSSFVVKSVPRLKFGSSFLRYRTFPFFLGERLAASLEGIDRLKGFTRLTLTLRCVREKTVGSGKNSRIEREVLYEEPVDVPPGDVAFGTGEAAGLFQIFRRVDAAAALPVTFELPDADLGSKLYDMPKRKWELTVVAEVPGVDFEETFLVPVYPAHRRSPAPASAPEAEAG